MAATSAARPLPAQASEVDAHLQHGDWFASAGQIAPALAMYRSAALQCEQAGDATRSLAIHARIARLDPDPGVRAHIGELQFRAGQRAAAAETWDGVARDEQRRGRLSHALAAATGALEAEPSLSRRWRLAELAQLNGQLETACDQLHALAEHELAAGQVARAQSLCLKALRMLPTHVPTLRVATDAFLRGRDAHRAVEAIRALLRIDRSDRVALEAMAEVFALVGKKDRAAETLRLLASRLADEGTRDDARALVLRAIAWRPGDAALVELQQKLEPKPENTRVLDIGDLIQMPPPRRATQPPTQRRAPPPLRRTDAYATR
jgi:tetratricopeptide (TPR) repeat protein